MNNIIKDAKSGIISIGVLLFNTSVVGGSDGTVTGKFYPEIGEAIKLISDNMYSVATQL